MMAIGDSGMLTEDDWPPNLGAHTKKHIRSGSWSIEKTDIGWTLKGEAYSPCCNPKGQMIFLLDKVGNVYAQTLEKPDDS